MSESNIIFSTNSFDTSVNIHNMSPIKKKQLPLHPPSFVLRPPVVNGDRSTRQRITNYRWSKHEINMATSSLTWYHGGQTRIQRDIPGHSGWVFFGGVIHCISIFRSGKNGARRTSSRSSVSHPPVSVLNPIAFPRGHGWTWTPGYIPMLRYYTSSADINMELAIAVCTTDPIGSMYAIYGNIYH